MKEFFPVLRSSQLFSGVSEEELTAMLTCLGAEKRSFPKEAFLLRSGDTAESIGLVLSGSVLVIQEDIWGNRNILSKAGPGQTFAAAYACAPGSVLNVSVVAETPVTVLLMNVKRILNGKAWFTDSDCCVESVFLGIRRKNYESGDNVIKGTRFCGGYTESGGIKLSCDH